MLSSAEVPIFAGSALAFSSAASSLRRRGGPNESGPDESPFFEATAHCTPVPCGPRGEPYKSRAIPSSERVSRLSEFLKRQTTLDVGTELRPHTSGEGID
jgi:hypothetical protein